MSPNRLEVPVQIRLAGLWASAMFLYVYVDIVSLSCGSQMQRGHRAANPVCHQRRSDL